MDCNITRSSSLLKVEVMVAYVNSGMYIGWRGTSGFNIAARCSRNRDHTQCENRSSMNLHRQRFVCGMKPVISLKNLCHLMSTQGSREGSYFRIVIAAIFILHAMKIDSSNSSIGSYANFSFSFYLLH